MIEEQKFNYGKLFIIGFGFFGVSVLWSLYNTYVPILLERKFLLDSAQIGFFMSLDNIAALFIQPPVGAWSDRLRTKLGRRLPFILVGAPIAAIAFGLVPLAASLPIFVACTITTILAMAFWRTPVVALMPDVTPSRLRSQANGIINFMGGLGLVLGTSVGSMLVARGEAYPFWFGSLLVLVAAALVLIFVREPKVYEDNPNTEKPNLWQSLKELFTSKQADAIRIFLAIFFWFIAYNAIEAFLSLYGVNHLGLNESGAGQLITSVGFSFLLFSIPAGFIGAKLGRKRTIGIGLLIMIIMMIIVYVLPKRDTPPDAWQAAYPGQHYDPDTFPARGWYRLGMHQYQLFASGRGSYRCDSHWHLYWSLLPLFHPGCDCRTEHQRMDCQANRQQLLLDLHHWTDLYDCRPDLDPGDEIWRSNNAVNQRKVLELN